MRLSLRSIVWSLFEFYGLDGQLSERWLLHQREMSLL